MRIARSASALRAARAAMPGRVAFVPTMGCLHEGHMALVRRAKALADHVVVSIYVNPLQFGPQEDYQAYPRTPEEDAAKLRAEGVDLLFMPETLYPEGEPEVRVRAGKMSKVLCGAYRPGHFDGVLTVVAILFHLVRPDLAVFGEKDWQQLVLIRRMVRDLAWGIEVIGVPTVREPDGLAMSSRNRYLAPAERKQAQGLFAALSAMREAARQGETRVDRLVARGQAELQAHGIAPQYLEIRDEETLESLETLTPRARAFVAAFVGKARLIDNMPMR